MKIKKHIAISDSGLIINTLTGESFTVNYVGMEILCMLKKEKSDTDIKQSILSKYQTDEKSFELDLRYFVNELGKCNLIEG